jgi:hypothetical protein
MRYGILDPLKPNTKLYFQDIGITVKFFIDTAVESFAWNTISEQYDSWLSCFCLEQAVSAHISAQRTTTTGYCWWKWRAYWIHLLRWSDRATAIIRHSEHVVTSCIQLLCLGFDVPQTVSAVAISARTHFTRLGSIVVQVNCILKIQHAISGC